MHVCGIERLMVELANLWFANGLVFDNTAALH